MRAAHVASFRGNIGDIINHQGFYRQFHDVVGFPLDITQFEIRDFYRNARRRSFDFDLVDMINQHDFLILGGGGFFDARWDESFTGTTLDMPDEFIDALRVPVLVNAMGYHTLKDTHSLDNHAAKESFIRFLENIALRDTWMVTVRNDGSTKRLASDYSPSVLNLVTRVPDNGFFLAADMLHCTFENERVTIGLNITNDLFSHEFNGDLTTDIFNEIIFAWIKKQVTSNCRIILFAHTPQDIKVINALYSYLGPDPFRYNIIIAPYDATDPCGAKLLSGYYRVCDCVVAMRFHANILAIQNHVPVIGLAGHKIIQALYDELGLSSMCVPINDPCFIDALDAAANSRLSLRAENQAILEQTMVGLYNDSHQYFQNIKLFLEGNI